MKKILAILAILCMGMAFSQVYRTGAFYGDLSVASPSNYTLLGQLPPNACITDIRILEGVLSTNTLSTNSVQVGISTMTNYFLSTTQCPMVVAPGIIRPTTAATNVGIILSTKNATLVYGYLTRVGAQVSAVGTVRVVIDYIQK